MPPRDFSQDGAFGAGTSSTPSGPGTPSTTTKGGWSGVLGSPSYGTDPGNTAAYEQASQQTPSFKGGGGFPMDPANMGAYRQAYGLGGVGLAFEDGGDVGDGSGSAGDSNGSPQQDAIQKALSTVDGVLAYGRKLHGLGGDGSASGGAIDADDGRGMPASWNQQGQGHDYSGFNQSPNVEDRRADTSPPTAGSPDRRTNFDDLADRVQSFRDGYNPMSQSLGINDVGTTRQSATGVGAINTEENQ